MVLKEETLTGEILSVQIKDNYYLKLCDFSQGFLHITLTFGNNDISQKMGCVIMNNKVEICGVNTSKLPVLTNDEKKVLFERIKKGDKAAREEFINGNLKLVLSVVQRFSGRGENPDDLFQIGCVGLIKSIDNFDTTLNVQFSTYAVPMIIGEIRRYLRDNNMVRVSRSVRDLAYKVLQVKERKLKETGKEPTIDEIAKELEVEREDVVMSLDAVQDPISLQEPVYNDGQDSIYIMDQVKDKKNTDEAWTENLTISEAMKRLTEKEKTIINKRFFEARTQMEVADEIGISQAQVSRIEKSAIDHIRRLYK